MRILHTSDWHLGRGLHRTSLLEAQRAVMGHLVDTVRERRPDALLVSGDVYDRAVPPLSAVRLFDETLHRLADLDTPVVLIPGNHDSPARLGVGSGLLARAGIHLRTDPDRLAEPVLLHDAHGPVACYGIPYLEPTLVRDRFGLTRGGHEEVLGAAVKRIRADLAGRPTGTRSVVLVHAFVAGGQPSDSERDITVGGVAAVPASLFDGIDYTALGHLHGARALTDRVRYSGSPLAYSFSEADHRKIMWWVELGPTGDITAEAVEHPVPHRLLRVRGTLDELLAAPVPEGAAEALVEVTLTDSSRPDDPMSRLTGRFPHLLSLRHEPETPPESAPVRYAERLRGRDDRRVAEDFVAHVRHGRGPDAAERALLLEALEIGRAVDTDRDSSRQSGTATGR
ncbi:exonuclease SbcCD subunit D [Streptomyces sp. ST2-7A]|uniref:exonuclease SbcCD subunit D n=1 Tax=Streptomyces sp. ST2-7A TaxID=2907214 RepID=UPI001F3B4C3C|nr:exonuclease SbcCD subunit D [Streptomyces sp. ST2-7A]MCE7079418.1 exonuclease SbcCD subunit D [Streptomyces sp. ST2-7A]